MSAPIPSKATHDFHTLGAVRGMLDYRGKSITMSALNTRYDNHEWPDGVWSVKDQHRRLVAIPKGHRLARLSPKKLALVQVS